MLPEFLNVDLELESKESLDLIAQEFGDRIHVLHNGPMPKIPYLLAVELYSHNERDPESIIASFCDLAEALTPKGRAKWRQCTLRRFDIGIESGTGKSQRFGALCLRVSPSVMKRVAVLSAEMIITVYPPLVPQTSTTPRARVKRK